jgi:hypothetical protein
MKYVAIFLAAALSLPASAGIIRHDLPDSVYTEFARDAAFNGVGLIAFETAEDSYTCSGTVINKNWVLTAGHCVKDSKAMSFYLPGDTGWRFYEATSWVAHENFNDDLLSGWDIGLMHFDTDFDVAPTQLYSGGNELLSPMASVGFGYSGNGYTGVEFIDYQRRAGTNIIDDLWSNEGTGQQIIWADFDHPDDSSYNLFNYLDYSFDDLASLFEIMAAPGDSGGAVFIEEGGQAYLAGIHSFGGDFNGDGIWGYGDAYGSTRVSSFTNWIQNKINPVSVPESNTLILLLIGLLGVLVARNRA